jgi:DHA3 family macrolide efflux protein-like MFS transporter
MDTAIAENSGWKRITLFLVSQNISLFGSSVVGFAVIWHITLTTSSGTWLMLSTICSLLPQVLVSLPGGVLADRYSRKHLIMLSDSFIALATLGLAIILLLGFERLELLLMVLAVRSIGAGIQTPAVGAIFPQLVPQEQLTRVQGINQTLNSVLMLLTPAVGGLILGWVGIVATFFLDVATAVVAVLVMSALRVEKINYQKASGSVWGELRGGLDYAFRHPQLRRIIICLLFSFFLITPAAVLSPLMVGRTFGNDVWRLTANEMAWTAGSFFGGVFVSLKGQFKDKVRTVSICLVAFGVLFGLLGVAWNFASFLAFMGIAGFFLPPIATAQTVHIQEITEPEILGRVFSIVQLISASAMPVAILLFGPLADVVSVESILLVSGVLLALVGIIYGRRRTDAAST